MKHIDTPQQTHIAPRTLIEPGSITTRYDTCTLHIMRIAQRLRQGFKIPHSRVFSSLPRVTIVTIPSTPLTLGTNSLFVVVLPVHRCWCDGIQTESHYHKLLISLRDGWMDGWMDRWNVVAPLSCYLKLALCNDDLVFFIFLWWANSDGFIICINQRRRHP